MKIIGCMAPEIWRNKVFCQFGPFLLFEPPNNHKNQNFQKSEKQHLEILAFHTSVSQKAIIWSMVPEILSARDRFFCHFGLCFVLLPYYQPEKSNFWQNENNAWIYHHFTLEYHKWQSYYVWFLRYGVQQT